MLCEDDAMSTHGLLCPTRFVPQILISAVGEEIITLCITFLRSSDYIKNPYLKSSLVTLLFSGTWPIYHLKRGVLGDALAGSDFANEHLLHAHMKWYIGKESAPGWKQAMADSL